MTITFTPLADDGRRDVTLEWGEEKTIGRAAVSTRGGTGIDDWRVSREHVHIAANKCGNGPSSDGLSRIRLTVLSQHGATVRRNGFADTMVTQGDDIMLITGDMIMLVDDTKKPPKKPADAIEFRGNPCAYRVHIPLRKRAVPHADDDRHVRARQEQYERARLEALVEEAQRRAAAAEKRAAQAEARAAQAEAARQQADARAQAAEAARKEAETRAQVEESVFAARARKMAQEATEATLAWYMDDTDENSQESAAATQRGEETQVMEEDLDPDREQLKWKQQMGSYGTKIQADVKSIYNVPKNRGTFRSQLEYAKEKRGMPQALLADLDQLWLWRNISVHPGKDLPDRKQVIVPVVKRVRMMLNEEDQRLNAHLLKP